MNLRGRRADARGVLSLAMCLSGASSSADAQHMTAIGSGEGALNIIAWEGYTQDAWVKPFERRTGCTVHADTAGSSDDMIALMRRDGGQHYDIVSASGDASMRLIFARDVRPIDVTLIPEWKNFFPQLRSPAFNTVNETHFGISYEWGPNVLLWNKDHIDPAPDSWQAIYSPAHSGEITVPDNPIQIADGALYLSKAKPELAITDPYELTGVQMDAVVALLKQQRPLLKKYWTSASDEVTLFRQGGVLLGAGWPYVTNKLRDAGMNVGETIPREGVTGWADSWMISAHARHVNCAYRWINFVSTPRVQAQQALSFGETPANAKACPEMDKMQKGACKTYHADAPAAYFDRISFWKTPVRQCRNGMFDCLDYAAWQKAWRGITK